MNLVLKKIRKMEAYLPPLEKRQKFQGLRLDFNERTAPLPKKITNAIKQFDVQRSKLYPSYGDLESKIATYAGVGKAMITNGSDHGIELIFRTFIEEGDKVVIPSP